MAAGKLQKIFNGEPLHWEVNSFVEAAGNGDLHSVKKFLGKYKCAIDKKDKHGSTALMHAAMKGKKPVVDLLLERGASVHEKNGHGNSALMFAAMYRHNGIMISLMERGAAHDEPNDFGMTALIFAAREGHKDTIEILLEKGVAIQRMDENGIMASMYAKSYKHPEVAHLLEHWPEIKEQRRKEKELADELADYSPALKRPIRASRPLKSLRPH